MPKGNYLKRLQAVKKQFVWLKATQLDAINGGCVTIIWTLVAYSISVATNPCVPLEARGTRNLTPIILGKCGGIVLFPIKQTVPLLYPDFNNSPPPSQIVIGAYCQNKD